MPAGLEGPPWQDAETVESTAHVATGRRKRLEMTVIETAFSSSIPVELPFFFSVDQKNAAWKPVVLQAAHMAHICHLYTK